MRLPSVVAAVVATAFCVSVSAAFADSEEGFEAYEAGGKPGGGWTLLFNALADPTNNRVVDTQSCSGRKSLQLYGSHEGTWAGEAELPLFNYANSFFVEGMVRPDDSSAGPTFFREAEIGIVYRGDSRHAYKSARIVFTANDFIAVGLANAVSQQALAYTPNKWYRCRLSVLPAYKRAFFTVDGHYFGSRNIPAGEWAETGFRINVNSPDGRAWFDDISSRGASEATAPYLEPMAFLIEAIKGYQPGVDRPANAPVSFPLVPAPVAALYATGIPEELQSQMDRLKSERKLIVALGGVDLEVTDPLRRSYGKAGGALPGASYEAEDLDGNGDAETAVLLDAHGFAAGHWDVRVTNPDKGAGATYSLFFYDPDRELLMPLGVGATLDAGVSADYRFETAPEPAQP